MNYKLTKTMKKSILLLTMLLFLIFHVKGQILIPNELTSAETLPSKYKTTFETQRVILRTDDQLKQQVLQGIAAKPDALRVQQKALQEEQEAIWLKKEIAYYIGGTLMVAGDWGPSIKVAVNEFKDLLPKSLQKVVDIGTSVGKVYDAFPQYSKDYLNTNVFKYFNSEYWTVDIQKKWDEKLSVTYPTVIAAAIKQNPQNPNTALDALANQLQDPYIKAEFNKFRNKYQGVTFENPNNLNFQQASQKLKGLDTDATNWVNISADIHAETIFNEEMQYYVAQKYSSELNSLQNQASTLQRELRNSNLTQQQIAQKQAELQKTVTKIGISLDGFQYATNKRLGSIEEKIAKYGSITEQLLLEIKLEKTPLDNRVKMLEDLLQRANNNLPTPISKAEIVSYLEKDKELQKIEEKKQIVNVAQFAIQIGNGALELMNTLEIGSAKDRQYVAYGLKVAEIGVNIYAGNYIAAFKSVMSLFGKPKPSPEMQMLSKILARLDQLEHTITTGFINLHNDLVAIHGDLVMRLDYISYQISDLRMEMIRDHQQIMTSLGEIENRLEYLVKQNNRLDAKLTALLGNGQDACYEPFITWSTLRQNNSDSTMLTPDYLNSFVEGTYSQPCFNSLLTTLNEDFVEGAKRVAFDYAVEPAESEYQHLYNQKDLFRKQVGFWNALYNTAAERDTAISSLLYPTIKTTEHLLPLGRLRSQKVKPVLNAFNTFDNVDYMNYKRVVQMANYVCDFYSLLSIYRNGQIMNAAEANANSAFLLFRTQALENGAKKTLALVEKAIAQESLIMGVHLFEDFYNTLNTSKYSPEEVGIGAKTLKIGQKIEEVFKVLRSNPIMARNFASYVMVKSMGSNNIFENNVKKYDDGIKKSVDFEKVISLNISQWLYMRVDKDGLGLGIQKQYVKNIGGINQMIEDHVYLPLVQDQEPVLNNGVLESIKEIYVVDKMMPTEGMMVLQQVREKLKALIIEVNMLKEVSSTDQVDKVSIKDLQFIVFSDLIMNKAYTDHIASLTPLPCVLIKDLGNSIISGPQKIGSGVTIIVGNKFEGENFSLTAGNSILLGPGTEIKPNTTFTASIGDGCPNN